MKERFEPIDEQDRSELFPALDGLIDRWCERRALPPLRLILVAYPVANPLADSLTDLHEVLALLEVLKDEITPEEREIVAYARRIAQFILDRR